MNSLDNLKLLIEKWSADRNLHTADSSKQALKLGEEYGELCEGLSKGKPELIKDALGDMFVVMVILAMQEDLDFTECVEMAYNEIKDREGKMINGVFVKESDLSFDEVSIENIKAVDSRLESLNINDLLKTERQKSEVENDEND